MPTDTAWHSHSKWWSSRLCCLNCRHSISRLNTAQAMPTTVTKHIFCISCMMLILLSTTYFVTNTFQSSTKEVVHARIVTPFNASFSIVLWPDVSRETMHSSCVLIKYARFVAAVSCPHMLNVTTWSLDTTQCSYFNVTNTITHITSLEICISRLALLCRTDRQTDRHDTCDNFQHDRQTTNYKALMSVYALPRHHSDCFSMNIYPKLKWSQANLGIQLLIIRLLSEKVNATHQLSYSCVKLTARRYKSWHWQWVSLKHDGTDGTVKMANQSVPSVTDRRDRQETAKTWQERRDIENGQSACPVCLWQTGQQIVQCVCDDC